MTMERHHTAGVDSRAGMPVYTWVTDGIDIRADMPVYIRADMPVYVRAGMPVYTRWRVRLTSER